MKTNTNRESILEQRAVTIPLNAVMFITNFFLVYFVWLMSAPEMTGLGRIISCWVAAYGLTWMMTYLAKGKTRLVVAVLLLGVLIFVLTFKR